MVEHNLSFVDGILICFTGSPPIPAFKLQCGLQCVRSPALLPSCPRNIWELWENLEIPHTCLHIPKHVRIPMAVLGF